MDVHIILVSLALWAYHSRLWKKIRDLGEVIAINPSGNAAGIYNVIRKDLGNKYWRVLVDS
jgi:hypothetical protein